VLQGTVIKDTAVAQVLDSRLDCIRTFDAFELNAGRGSVVGQFDEYRTQRGGSDTADVRMAR